MRTVPEDLDFLPPHAPTVVAGLHAYSHRLRAVAGDEVDVRVSGEGPVEIDVVRYGYSRQDVTAVATVGRFACSPQPIHRGDYVHVAKPVTLPDAFTLECWVRVLDDRKRGGLIAQVALSLAVEAGGALTFRAGSVAVTGSKLERETWHYVVAVVARAGARLYVDGGEVGRNTRLAGRPPSSGPLLLGASLDAEGRADSFLTGDLYGPAVYGRALAPEEIAKRYVGVADRPADGCLARWVFDDRGGVPYRDATGNGHDGRPVNYPTRMIPGPRIRENADWCTYDPANDPDFGYAARFFRDTLVDCRWPVTARWRVPEGLATGQYALRVRDGAGNVRLVDVVVRPGGVDGDRVAAAPRLRAGAVGVWEKPLMCISTTHTRIAYNFASFGNVDLDCGAYQTHASYPLRGTFNGVRRPAGGEWYGHTVDFELPWYDWLDRQGLAYDLYTEWDLEEQPELTEAYPVIAIAGHSEYWSADFYEILKRHVERGGHLLLMTGNTGFWRVSTDRKNQVVEIRKHECKPVQGTDSGPMIAAAYFHQLDGRPGSYMHWSGYPVYALTGGFSTGYTQPPINGPRVGYRVLLPDHPLFQTPHQIATAGEFAPKAAGYETDIAMRNVLERYGDPRRAYYPHVDGTPPPRLADAFDAGLQVLARAAITGDHVTFSYDVDEGVGEMGADMLYRRWPSGGSVFHAGSVLSAWTLREDENFSKFVRNVLHAMGVKAGDQSDRAAGQRSCT